MDIAHEACPCAVEASGFDEGADGEHGLPALDAPSHAGALHSLCSEYLVGGFDAAGSDGAASVSEVAVSHALAVLAEEGEVALDGVGVPACLVAEAAPRPYDPGAALRVVSQDMAASLEPAGIEGMVAGCAEMLVRVPEIDRLRLGREALQEGPVVGGAIGDGGDGDIGARPPDMRDLACELGFQRVLAALRHAGEIEGLEPFAFSVVEGDRPQAASARPSSPAGSATMTPSSETEALTAPGAMSSVLRMLSSACGPRLSRRSCMVRASRCSVLADATMAPICEKNASASRAVQGPVISSPSRATGRVSPSFTSPGLTSTGTNEVRLAPWR